MPSAWGYGIGGAIIVVSAIVGIVLLVNGFSSVAQAFSFPQRVQSDGTIEITRPGPYIVYEIQPEPAYGMLPTKTTAVTVTDPRGNVKYAGVYNGNRTSSSGLEQAVAVVTFHADSTGVYHVTSPRLSPGHSLAVGDGRAVKSSVIAFGFVVGGLGFLIGLAVIIVTAARRHGAKPRPVLPMYGPAPAMPHPQGMPPQPGWAPPPVPPADPPGAQEWWHHQGPPTPPTA